jgi:hypothetical protein
MMRFRYGDCGAVEVLLPRSTSDDLFQQLGRLHQSSKSAFFWIQVYLLLLLTT